MNYEQYKENYNTGCYIRIDTNNVLIEDHTYDQVQEWLSTLSQEGLIRLIHSLIITHQQKDYLIRSLLQHNPTLTIPQDIQKELTSDEDN